MPLPNYTYGTFQLNDGVNYFVTDKKLGLPEVQESVFKVARYPGVKTTGTIINERRATVTVVVVGSSRTDLESKVDALLLALNQRQQQLAIHMLDGRYLVCDAISAPVTYRSTRLLAVTIQITFLAVDPYLYAANASSYDSGSIAYTLVSGSNYTSGNLVVASSGTEYAYPTIALTNNSAVTITAFTLSQNPDGTSLQISNLSWTQGETITIGCDPRQANGYTVVSSAAPGTLLAFSGTFPVIEPTGTVLTLQVTASAQPTVDLAATWTPRWLS